MESLTIDGEGGGDTLTITGTANDETITHTPIGIDSGSTSASDGTGTLLGASYRNLGVAGSINIDGAGGTDTVIASGTAPSARRAK